MPGVARESGALRLVEARQTKGRVAKLGTGVAVSARVAPVTLTNDAEVAAGASATMTLSSSVSPSIAAEVGQYIQFGDANGVYPARVRTRFVSGTSLEIEAFETIPASATAEFPPELDLLTDLSDSGSTGTNSVSVFKSVGAGETSRDTTERTASATGFGSWYDAGGETVQRAFDDEADVYFEIEEPSPDSSVYTTNGKILWGVAVINDLTRNRANGDKVGLDFSLQFSGALNTVDPA